VIEQRPKTTTLLSTLSTPVNDERRQPPRCLRTGASRDSASFPPSIFPTFDSAPPRHCHRRTPPLPHDSSANSLPHLLPQRPPPPFVEGAALRASRVSFVGRIFYLSATRSISFFLRESIIISFLLWTAQPQRSRGKGLHLSHEQNNLKHVGTN